MLSHPTHAINPRKSSFTALFSLIAYEENIMQTDYTQSANPAQNYQTQSSGITFVILFSIALFCVYAIQHGLIVEGFIYALSYFFSDFHVKIHANNLVADIALLAIILLALYGLACVLKNFLQATIAVIVIWVIGAVFLWPTDNKLEPAKFHTNDKLETVRGG